MDSNEIEIEQSTTELKYLWILKKIAVRFVVVLLNVYDFAKENSGDFKTTVVSAENVVASTFGPLYGKLKDLPEQTLVFVDDKVDKYAPSIAKKFIIKSQSLIYKTKPLVKKLVTTTQAITTPLITATIFLLQTTKYFIQSITPLQRRGTTTQTQSRSLVATTQSLLQNTLDVNKSLVPNTIGNVAQSLVANPTNLANTMNPLANENPLLGAVNSGVEKSLDTTKSLVTNTVLQQGPDLANLAPDTTESLIGNVAQSLVANPTDLANENPLLGAVNSAAEKALDTTKSLATDTILQKGPNTTKSLFGGLPLVGNIAQSLTTNPTDLANQIVNTTNSLVKENPVLEAVNLAAQDSLDTTNSLAGGIPLVGNVAQSLTTNPADLANQIVNTTNSLVKDNPVLEAVNSAAQNSLDANNSLAGGIPLVGNLAQSLTTNPTDLANQIANTTNSLVEDNPVLDAVNSAAKNSLDATNSLAGGIPLVGNVTQSLTTNPADLANQIVNTANSLVNENPLLEAVNSAAQNIGNKPEATGTKAALQSAYMTLKVAGIPVIAQLWYEVVNKYPTVGELSEFILPVVECVFVLYNKVVEYMDRKGYSISGYLPIVPIDEMKAAYKLVKTSRDGLSAVGDLLGVNNNKGLSAVGDLIGVNKNN